MGIPAKRESSLTKLNGFRLSALGSTTTTP